MLRLSWAVTIKQKYGLTSFANSSNLALFMSCCLSLHTGLVLSDWSPLGGEGIVQQVEAVPGHLLLIHLKSIIKQDTFNNKDK
jgi:hypothetical protein